MADDEQLVKLIIPDEALSEEVWAVVLAVGRYQLKSVPLSPDYCPGDIVAAYQNVITGTIQKVANWDAMRAEADQMWAEEWAVIEESFDFPPGSDASEEY